MKKLLLFTMMTSSLLIGGDLQKCTHAIEMKDKYLDLSMEKLFEQGKKQIKINVRSMSERGKELLQKEILQDEKEIALYSELFEAWREEYRKECKGVLSDKTYNSFIKSKK